MLSPLTRSALLYIDSGDLTGAQPSVAARFSKIRFDRTRLAVRDLCCSFLGTSLVTPTDWDSGEKAYGLRRASCWPSPP